MTPEQKRKMLILRQRQKRGPVADANNRQHSLQVLEALEERGALRPGEAEELERLRASSGADQQAVGGAAATYRGALQGATFRQADEIYGLLGGDKQAARDANARAQADHPEAYATGETAGAALTSLGTAAATAPIGVGASLGRQALLGAGIGGAEGFAWGSGGAVEGEKMAAGARGAQGGAMVGFAAPMAIKGAGAAIGFADDVVRGSLNLGNPGRANRAIAQTVRKSGNRLADIADQITRAAQQGQPEYRLMDALGTMGQRRANGIVRAGGDGAEEIAAFLKQRQLDQGDRVSGFIDDAFGTGGTTAQKTTEHLEEARSIVADRMYSQARKNAAPVDVRRVVGMIDQRIGGMKGSNIAGDSIDAKMQRFRNRLMADPAPNGEMSRELSDFGRVLGVKQDIQDAVGAATRSGRYNEARELGKLAAGLDRALEQSSDAYRLANDNFREASRVIESVSRGGEMATKGRAADNVAEIADMTPDQRRAAQVGYGDTLLGKIEAGTAPTSNNAKRLSSTKARTEADALANDPELYASRIDRENTMWETQNYVLGGSRTADNQADMADLTVMADAARAGRELASGNGGNAISQVGGTLMRIAQGQNEATRKLVADILMSPNPRKAMSIVMQSESNAQKRRWIAQTVTRALAQRQVQ